MYSNLEKLKNNIKANLLISFVQGPKVEIISPVVTEYLVEFINAKTEEVLHRSVIESNCWTKCFHEYFIDWQIKLYEKEDGVFKLVKDYRYNAENTEVYIALDSKSLGDTLAWFPYVREFAKKHKCRVTCSTFHNYLFEEQYPDIKFVKPGEIVHNLYAMYMIGWFYNEDGSLDLKRNPKEVKNVNLQQTASDILGLDFKEVVPELKNYELPRKEQIAIAMHSTAQAKYWNNLTGWQDVVNWCKAEGYDVIMMSKEEDGYMGNRYPEGVIKIQDTSLVSAVRELQSSKAFIGISSGLSWLSWACKTPTLIVSGFTEEYTEPLSCSKANTPEGKCKGCFNSYKLDAGDWNWCPVHKDTGRQFECSKSITSDVVIEKLKKLLELA